MELVGIYVSRDFTDVIIQFFRHNSKSSNNHRYCLGFLHAPHSFYLYLEIFIFGYLFVFLDSNVFVSWYCYIDQGTSHVLFVFDNNIWSVGTYQPVSLDREVIKDVYFFILHLTSGVNWPYFSKLWVVQSKSDSNSATQI